MSQDEVFTKELAYLRECFDADMREIQTNERYALVITGAVWSWCATNDEAVIAVLWWFPTLACILLGIRSFATYVAARSARSAIQRVHEQLGVNERLSWERSTGLNKLRGATFFTFWMVMQPATFVVAAFMTRGPAD